MIEAKKGVTYLETQIILAFLIGTLVGLVACKIVTGIVNIGVIEIQDLGDGDYNYKMQLTDSFSKVSKSFVANFWVKKVKNLEN